MLPPDSPPRGSLLYPQKPALITSPLLTEVLPRPGTLVNRPIPFGGTEHQNAGFWQAGECGLDHTGCPQAATAYPHLCEVGRGGVGGQAPSAALQGVPEPKVRPPVTSEPPASPTRFSYIQHSQWFNSSVPTGRVWGSLGQAQTPVCAHPAPVRCSFMPSASGGADPLCISNRDQAHGRPPTLAMRGQPPLPTR